MTMNEPLTVKEILQLVDLIKTLKKCNRKTDATKEGYRVKLSELDYKKCIEKYKKELGYD